MNNRLFILTNDPVPYGTANSNYIRNFANAVSFAGMTVIVIGMKREVEQQHFFCCYETKSIQYWNINDSRTGAKNYLRIYFNSKQKYMRALKEFNAGADDYIVVYSTELDTAKAAILYKEVPHSHKAFCEVEWFQPYQYRFGRINPLYILWRVGFNYRINHFLKAIPISEKLDEFFRRRGCSTIIVPALVDSFDIVRERNNDQEYVHFIYPGSATDKDSFPCMINAFASLSKESMDKVRFHLTGSMSVDRLRDIIGIDKVQLDRVKNILIFHGWLTYEELMNLYCKIDYLLLARNKNVVTLSNFPSKVPEMLSYGVVPVCSAVGDYTEKYLVDGIDSIHFKEDNVESCRNAIIYAINNKEKGLLDIMQVAARRTSIEKFDYRNWGSRITDFLIS